MFDGFSHANNTGILKRLRPARAQVIARTFFALNKKKIASAYAKEFLQKRIGNMSQLAGRVQHIRPVKNRQLIYF